MSIVNMLEAKTSLSRLVEQVESGAEAEVIIARNGKPAARLVPLATVRPGRRQLGQARNGMPSLSQDDFDASNAEIAKLWKGDED